MFQSRIYRRVFVYVVALIVTALAIIAHAQVETDGPIISEPQKSGEYKSDKELCIYRILFFFLFCILLALTAFTHLYFSLFFPKY